MTSASARGMACLACAVLFWLCGPLKAQERAPRHPTAEAAWAEADITPPLGIALGGRGGPETLADKLLDPLSAQLLYLKDAKGTGLVLVSFDLIGLPRDLSDHLRTLIAQELGVQWNLIVLNTSHTHSGPYMLRDIIAATGPAPQVEVDYFRSLEEKVTSMARTAAKSLKPVDVKIYHGVSHLGINRRGKNPQGHLGMIPDDQAPFDEKVWVMKVEPKNGQAPAVVFSYACHAVIVYGYARSAISADFPGATRQDLRAALGSGAHVQFVQGFAGDIRPRLMADLENHRFRPSRPQDLEAAGKDLAGAVLAAMKADGQTLALDLAGAADRPFLPRGNPPPRELYEKMRATALLKTNAYHLALSEYWLKRYDSGQGFARGDAWSLGLIRLASNQWIVYSAGEPCIEWQSKISNWLAPLDVTPWGYSQEAKSYLPTESMLSEGGYEVLDSNENRNSTPAPFAVGIEAALRESLLRQLAFIRAQVQ
jgi:neutral ceramidase